MLAVLKNLHLVVGIVSLIIKVLGIGVVVQVALKEQQENIFLGRSVESLLQCTMSFSEMQGKCNAVFYFTAFSSFQLLIHLQKKTWLLMRILCLLPWQLVCAGRVSGKENASCVMWGLGKCLRTVTCFQFHRQSPLYGRLMMSGPSSILCLVCDSPSLDAFSLCLHKKVTLCPSTALALKARETVCAFAVEMWTAFSYLSSEWLCTPSCPQTSKKRTD